MKQKQITSRVRIRMEIVKGEPLSDLAMESFDHFVRALYSEGVYVEEYEYWSGAWEEK